MASGVESSTTMTDRTDDDAIDESYHRAVAEAMAAQTEPAVPVPSPAAAPATGDAPGLLQERELEQETQRATAGQKAAELMAADERAAYARMIETKDEQIAALTALLQQLAAAS